MSHRRRKTGDPPILSAFGFFLRTAALFCFSVGCGALPLSALGFS